MKVILYIGHHKVGSTALQAYLAQNWLPLARAGILYPAVEGLGFASNLAETLGRGTAKPQNVVVREPHSALAYRMIADASKRVVPKQFRGLPSAQQMIRAMDKQVAALSPHTLILCSEAFSNFGHVAAEKITTLCNAFPGAEFHVYCALRRPDDYLTSWHGQRLKVGELARPLHGTGARQYYNSIHFDYRMVLEEWVTRVPNAKISVRNYADILATGGSAEDFVAETGLELPEGMQAPGRANASLPLAAFSLMERAIGDLKGPELHKLSVYLQKHGRALSPVSNSEVELFGAEQRQQMHKDFQPSEAYLRSLTGRAAFFEDLDQVITPRNVPAEEASRQLLHAIDPTVLPPLAEYLTQLKQSF